MEDWAAGVCASSMSRPSDSAMNRSWRRWRPAGPIMSWSTRRTAFRNGDTIFGPNIAAWAGSRNCSTSPIAAFTATATPRVQKEIVANLKLRQPLIRVHGFYRPNLVFKALMEASERRRAELILTETDVEGASIVYCASRKRVDELADELRRAGRPAFAYHAGLERRRARKGAPAFSR